jgi:hypothetical protein
MKGETGGPELANAPQSLEGGEVDQINSHCFSGDGPIELDGAMKGIVVRALLRAHGLAPLEASSSTSNCSASWSHLSSRPPGLRGSGGASSTSGLMPRLWMS